MEITPETESKLKTYLKLLEKWQPKINLISNGTLVNAWERHCEDSMQLFDFLPEGQQVIFDLGSGAGFPGLVLAIMRPDISMHLIESDQKKCSFMKTVSRETDAGAFIHNERIEAVSIDVIPDIIMARALTSLEGLFDYCAGWIKANPKLQLIFPKGENADVELETLKKTWKFECATRVSKTNENAKILMFSNVYRA